MPNQDELNENYDVIKKLVDEYCLENNLLPESLRFRKPTVKFKVTDADFFKLDPEKLSFRQRLNLTDVLNNAEFSEADEEELAELRSQAELFCHIVQQQGATSEVIDTIVSMTTEYAKAKAHKALLAQQREFDKIRQYYDVKIQQHNARSMEVWGAYEGLRDKLNRFLSVLAAEYDEVGAKKQEDLR